MDQCVSESVENYESVSGSEDKKCPTMQLGDIKCLMHVCHLVTNKLYIKVQLSPKIPSLNQSLQSAIKMYLDKIVNTIMPNMFIRCQGYCPRLYEKKRTIYNTILMAFE